MSYLNVLFPEASAYKAESWDRFELSRLLGHRNNTIRSLRTRQQHLLDWTGYDLVSDAFYFLKGDVPLNDNGETIARVWQSLEKRDGIDALRKNAQRGPIAMSNAVAAIANLVANLDWDVVPDEDEEEPVEEPQPEDEQSDDSSEDEQEEAEGEPEEQDDDGETQPDGEEAGDQDSDAEAEQDAAGEDTEAEQEQPGSDEDGQGEAQPGPGDEDYDPDTDPDFQAFKEMMQQLADGTEGRIAVSFGGEDEKEQAGEQSEEDAAIAQLLEQLEDMQPDEDIEQANDTTESLADFQEAMQSLAGSGAPIEELEGEIAQLAQELDVRTFAGILGWASYHAGGAARSITSSRGVNTQIEHGNWSNRVITRDRAGVASGDLRTMVRVAESTLRVRRRESDMPAGRGAVICLHDESTSMLEPNVSPEKLDELIAAGERFQVKYQVSKQMELAIATEMNKQGRDLVSIAFSSGILSGPMLDRYLEKTDRPGPEERKSGSVPRTREYTYGDPNADPFEHLRKVMRGGTSIVPALEEAVIAASEYRDPCDVLILSDAEFGHAGLFGDDSEVELIEDILADYRKEGGRVWAILVGTSEEDATSIARWVDGYVTAESLEADADTGAILEAIARNPSREGSQHSRTL